MKDINNRNRINAARKNSQEQIVTELEVVDDVPQAINEMARIGFIKDKTELEVYVNTDDGGELPHFHVRDKATRGDVFHCCVRFDAPMYFPHEGKRSIMNGKQRKALVDLLNSVDKDSGKTLWWESLHEWNKNNSDVTVDLSTPMPDYRHLRMPDTHGKRDPMSKLQNGATRNASPAGMR